MFSYGANNVINLNNNRITQLTAVNGSGKSSIALILQEILYSKNIKAVKKGDILNRHITDKNWNAALSFSVNDIEYEIVVKRTGASSKVQLLREGVDISEHKVIDTYKRVQELLGLDFEIFSQITYQSSVDLLDFLKATDTNRKKFLINLFNLEKYLTIGDRVKVKSAEVDKQLVQLQGELKSVDSFLNSVVIPEPLTYKPELTEDSSSAIRIAEIDNELANINNTCKRIDKNNMYIAERNKLTFDVSLKEPEPFTHTEEYHALKHDLTRLNNELQRMQKEHDSVKINDTCPACGQNIDNSHLVRIKQELKEKIQVAQQTYADNLTQAKKWSEELTTYQAAVKVYKINQDAIHRFEQLSQLIDDTIATTYPDYAALTQERAKLQESIDLRNAAIREITANNKKVSAHNAKIEALKEQKSDFIVRQQAVKADILDKSSEANALSILKKAFSPSGIVAFKLESLTKELETTINYYLSVLSDGQFQVEFSLDKEKLNINVINNGISAPIETTSGGEFSRIQTSILLAIRNLLSKLGGSSINLLFLDEITGVLDAEGKEKLIEVLQREKDLNVFLISHDFTHPLIDKISITKTDNISSIHS
jgi:DNA repair exonuclease SbcCD ATPase subunit